MNNPDITKDTRLVILRVRSDGFEAHNVKGNLNKGKEGSSAHATKYMKMLGISEEIVDGKGLIASLRNGQPLVESESSWKFKILQRLSH